MHLLRSRMTSYSVGSPTGQRKWVAVCLQDCRDQTKRQPRLILPPDHRTTSQWHHLCLNTMPVCFWHVDQGLHLFYLYKYIIYVYIIYYNDLYTYYLSGLYSNKIVSCILLVTLKDSGALLTRQPAMGLPIEASIDTNSGWMPGSCT